MIFHRQKILLNFLKLANRPVSHLELMKWAFLLRYDSITGGGSSFYGFVPYDWGPCSFSLYREMDKLITEGLVVNPKKNYWAISEESKIPAISRNVMNDLSSIANRFSQENSLNMLLDYVYKKFPYFTINSKRINKPEYLHLEARIAIYTAGYEGLSVDEFLNKLVENGIKALADVRHNPMARRYGFHKSTLSRLCNNLGIEYYHFSKLGIRSEMRQDLNAQSDRDKLFKWYDEEVLESEQNEISNLSSLIKTKPTVLVCMENKPCECHRTTLAKRIATQTELEITNL